MTIERLLTREVADQLRLLAYRKEQEMMTPFNADRAVFVLYRCPLQQVMVEGPKVPLMAGLFLEQIQVGTREELLAQMTAPVHLKEPSNQRVDGTLPIRGPITVSRENDNILALWVEQRHGDLEHRRNDPEWLSGHYQTATDYDLVSAINDHPEVTRIWDTILPERHGTK